MDEKKTNCLYRVIRRLVRLFSPRFRVAGTENLPEEPCVIVGNHSQMYGPIAGELYTPGKHYIWCAGEMMHRKEVPAYAYQDFWSGKPKALRWFYKLPLVFQASEPPDRAAVGAGLYQCPYHRRVPRYPPDRYIPGLHRQAAGREQYGHFPGA